MTNGSCVTETMTIKKMSGKKRAAWVAGGVALHDTHLCFVVFSVFFFNFYFFYAKCKQFDYSEKWT